MDPVAFYPDSTNLKKGIALGVVLLVMGNAISGGLAGTLLIFLGFAVAGLSGYAFMRPSPCFEADADGFSVMGKTKRPWSEFQGAGVHVVRYSFIPIAKLCYVRVGKGKLMARKLHIRWTHLPLSPKETAQKIQLVATMAAAQQVPEMGVRRPVAQAPEPRDTAPVDAPRRPVRTTPAAMSDGGPIRSTRGLFGGRRKVI